MSSTATTSTGGDIESGAPHCTSCLDAWEGCDHTAQQCPYALLSDWGKCVDCLQPIPGLGGYDSDDSIDDDDVGGFNPEYICTCDRRTTKAVARREEDLGRTSTAHEIDCEELVLGGSPWSNTAVRDDPRCRVDETECPGARYVRLRLEGLMPARLIAGDCGPAVHYTAVDTIEFPVSQQHLWDTYVKHNRKIACLHCNGSVFFLHFLQRTSSIQSLCELAASWDVQWPVVAVLPISIRTHTLARTVQLQFSLYVWLCGCCVPLTTSANIQCLLKSKGESTHTDIEWSQHGAFGLRRAACAHSVPGTQGLLGAYVTCVACGVQGTRWVATSPVDTRATQATCRPPRYCSPVARRLQ
jgi:hypothetical protein